MINSHGSQSSYLSESSYLSQSPDWTSNLSPDHTIKLNPVSNLSVETLVKKLKMISKPNIFHKNFEKILANDLELLNQEDFFYDFFYLLFGIEDKNHFLGLFREYKIRENENGRVDDLCYKLLAAYKLISCLETKIHDQEMEILEILDFF